MSSRARSSHYNARDPRRDPRTGRYGAPYRAWTALAATDPAAALAELCEVLDATEGVIARTAHRLGLSPRNLYHWLRRLPGGWEAVNTARIARARKNLADPLRIGQ